MPGSNKTLSQRSSFTGHARPWPNAEMRARPPRQRALPRDRCRGLGARPGGRDPWAASAPDSSNKPSILRRNFSMTRIIPIRRKGCVQPKVQARLGHATRREPDSCRGLVPIQLGGRLRGGMSCRPSSAGRVPSTPRGATLPLTPTHGPIPVPQPHGELMALGRSAKRGDLGVETHQLG